MKLLNHSIETSQLLLVCIEVEHLGVCQLMNPVLEDMKIDYKREIQLVKMLKGQDPEFESDFAITRYPALLFFQRSNLVHQQEGLVSRKELYARIDQILQA